MSASAVSAGTFATGSIPVPLDPSEPIVVPTGVTTMRLTTTGLDTNNTLKTQKITAPGTAWVDQTTYNSDQANVAITVAGGEQWRVAPVTQQATRDVRFKLSVES